LCVAKIYHFVKTYDNPRKHADEILKLSKRKSKKNFLFSDIILRTIKMNPEEVHFPKDQKERFAKRISYNVKDVTDAISGLAKESPAYLKPWEVREVNRELVGAGIFNNIRGKKTIKQVTPQAFPRLRKGQPYEKSKREGYHSAYKITEDLAVLNKIISNPKARELIHKRLKGFEAVKEFFIFKGLAVMYALGRGDERMFQLATIGSQAILDSNADAQLALRKTGLDDQQIQHSTWEPIRSYLLSLSEENLEQLVKEMVEYLLENPIDDSYLLLAICRE